MARSATGHVRLVRGKWLASLRGEHLGSHATKQEALDAIAAALRIDSGTAPDSLRVFGEKWLDERELGGDIRGIAAERSAWATHVGSAKFYDWPLRKVRPVDVQQWLGELSKREGVRVTRSKVAAKWVISRRPSGERISRQTVVHARRLLSQCFRSALIAGKVPSNPVEPCITPTMAGVVEDDEHWTFLSLGEVAKLFDAIDEGPRAVFYRAWYAVAIYGGLRQAEIKGLRWEDVRDGQLHVRRSSRGALKERSSRRDVPMLRSLRDALDAWKRHDGTVKLTGLVFAADHGSHFNVSYDAAWERWRAKAGIRDSVRAHDLRHTCGSHLVMGSWGRAFTLLEVRDWLGHSDVQTTQRYAHLAPGALKATVRDMEAKHADSTRSKTPEA